MLGVVNDKPLELERPDVANVRVAWEQVHVAVECRHTGQVEWIVAESITVTVPAEVAGRFEPYVVCIAPSSSSSSSPASSAALGLKSRSAFRLFIQFVRKSFGGTLYPFLFS